MDPLIIVLIILGGVILLFTLLSYIVSTNLLNKSFSRMDFEKGKELISYDEIKDKYERSEYEFKSKKNTLKAYLYKKNASHDLVLYVHGMCAGHQGYLSDVIAFLDKGYNVFTYDFTGTGASGGKRYCGLNQQYFDLRCAIKFLKENNLFGYQNIYLYGHSMGGYAVACTNDDIFKAVVSISGFDSHIDELVSAFSKNAKPFVKALVKVMIGIKYFIDQGIKCDLKAHNVLKKTNIPTFVIHGTNDELVPFDKVSIISKKDKINNEMVEYLEMSEENHSSHNSVIASTRCVEYQKEKYAIYQKAMEECHNHKKARDTMVEKDFDVFKFNEANPELMNIIDEFYSKYRGDEKND